MASDQAILTNLTNTLKSYLPAWYGEGSQLLPDSPQRSDRPFTIFLNYNVVTADNQEIRLILKLPRDHWMHSLQEILDSEHIRNFARQEADILQGIEAAVHNSGNPNLWAIRTLAYLPEFCAVVMEHSDFTTFKRKYLSLPPIFMRSATLHAAKHDAFLAGTWLKLYHDTFAQKNQIPTSHLPILDTIHERLQKIETLSENSLKEIYVLFQARYKTLQDVLHPVSKLHNDFHFNNVILTWEGKVGAFDPNPKPSRSIYVDVARILTDCVIRKKQVFSRGLFFGNKFIQMLQTSFINGYKTPLDDHVLNFYCAATVLEKWVDDEEDLQTSRLKTIYSLLFRNYYKKKIQNYLS